MNKETIEESKFKDISLEVFDKSTPLRGNNKKAQIVGIKVNENGNVTCEVIEESPDVYNLFDYVKEDSEIMSKIGEYDMISILTAGWAAPVNEDGNDNLAPSQHPERKRVLISIMGYTLNQISSVMAFEGEDVDHHYDYNKGQGALRDAFDELLIQLNWR